MFFVPKCCKFSASAKLHIKQFFAALRAPTNTEIVASYEHGNHNVVPEQDQKVQFSHVQIAKKSKALFLVPKCCKLAASAKKHVKQFFCTYEQGIHETSCKQWISTYGNEVHTKQSQASKYRMRKSKIHYFCYQKGPKIDSELFVSETLNQLQAVGFHLG